MEETLKSIIFEYKEWSYVVIFFWCMLEGELALILAGVLAHEGHVNLIMITFIAGLGGFAGDQIYFYIGRYNKSYIQKKLVKQRRKFAVAHLLLKKYGWLIILVQRYMYGFRTVIPMSIGITRYDAKKFALINLLSAWIWAGMTISLAWYFGSEIWLIIEWAESHWYLAIPILAVFLVSLLYGFKQLEKTILNERKKRHHEI